MWFLSTGVNHVWPLAWLAPLPLLVVLPDLRAGRAALAAFAAFAIGAVNLILAYPLPPIVLGLVVLLLPLPFTVLASIWRIVARRGAPRDRDRCVSGPRRYQGIPRLPDLPSRHVRQPRILPGGRPAGRATRGRDGLVGISFLVWLVPAVLAVAWRCRREPRVVYTGLAAAILPLALTLA